MKYLLSTAIAMTILTLTGCSIIDKATNPTDNSAPVISSSTPDGSPDIGCSGTLAFSVTATDPDNDPLTYAWTVSGGTMTGSTTAAMVWTAPATSGAQTVRITVSDGKGHSDTTSWSIPVGLVRLHGTISTDSVLNNPANDYYVDNDLVITGNVTFGRKIQVRIADNTSIAMNTNGKLTIMEGVVVSSGVGSYIESGYATSGTIIAQGSDSLPIRFTKTATASSAWGYSGGGILLYDKSTTQTSLNYCIIEYATTGIFVQAIKPVITHCTIRHNTDYGIAFFTSGANVGSPKDSASFVHNVIDSNGKYPIAIDAEGITSLSGETSMTGNGSQGIMVRDGGVKVSGTWRKHGIPYVFLNSCAIENATGATITVQPGTVFKFDADAYIQIGYNNPATFVANGTATDPITFTTTTPGSYWGYDVSGIDGCGILVYSKSTTLTSFQYCVIDSATGGIFTNAPSVLVSNCTIRDNQKSGLTFAKTGSVSSGFKDSASCMNNKIFNNGDYGIELYAGALGSLSGTDSIAGNAKGGIMVTGTAITSGTHLWKKYDCGYIVDGDIDITGSTGPSVTIRPGVHLAFTTGSYIQVGYGSYPGTLTAVGTASDSIVFTGAVAGSAWGYSGGGLLIYTNATSLTGFQYCDIGSATTGIFINATAAIFIDHCAIHDNSDYGIHFTKNTNRAKFDQTTCTFENNQVDDVLIDP